MPCVRIPNGVVCYGDEHSVKIGNRKYRFEMFGWSVTPVDRDGDYLDITGKPRKFQRKFWRKVKRHPAFIAWHKRSMERMGEKREGE